MKTYMNPDFPHFIHGADYNPEQWMADRDTVWDEDMRLMKLAHMNEMTVGIFSWAKLEPHEGEYDFSWLDDILDRIYKNGGRVLLSTPSGSRPRWLADAYPEVLRTDDHMVKQLYGTRHNHCLTSPAYRRKVYEINSRLAERYANHPALLGWHISNELSGAPCYCDGCRRAFRAWCRDKYHGDIEELNTQWWSTFWSHSYTSFDQIDPPTPIGDNDCAPVIDFHRFITDEVCAFFENEKAAIRRFSDAPVTTNIMWRHKEINCSKLTALCDFVSWDNYPSWHSDPDGSEEDNAHMAARYSIMHDRCRAYLQRPFLLMESTPSIVCVKPYNKLKRPGMHKLSSLQAVAHGSDSVQYFQFRKCRGGREALHGAVVDHSPTPEKSRVFSDVREVGEALKRIDAVCGSHTPVRVALIYDFENHWALDVKPAFQRDDKKYVETCDRIYFELWQHGINVDVIDARRDLSGYDLVIAPMLYSMYEESIRQFTDFVARGGVLIGGYMMAMANENDLCYMDGFPGGTLKDVFGLVNEEIDSISPNERNAVTYRGRSYTVRDFCERVHPYPDAEVLGTYERDFYAGEPALVKHAYGRGIAYYMATRDDGGLFTALLADVLASLGIEGPIGKPPYGVSTHLRTDGERDFVFVENYNDTERTVPIGAGFRDLEHDTPLGEQITLPPFGIAVLERPAKP